MTLARRPASALPTPAEVARWTVQELETRATALVPRIIAYRARCQDVAMAERFRRDLHALIGCFIARRAKVPRLEAEARRLEVQIGHLLPKPRP